MYYRVGTGYEWYFSKDLQIGMGMPISPYPEFLSDMENLQKFGIGMG